MHHSFIRCCIPVYEISTPGLCLLVTPPLPAIGSQPHVLVITHTTCIFICVQMYSGRAFTMHMLSWLCLNVSCGFWLQRKYVHYTIVNTTCNVVGCSVYSMIYNDSIIGEFHSSGWLRQLPIIYER
ncbi:hypothetical protein NP493_8g01010 [Ridgeia piscesae]|uniref:Uncharacterized protein n=1 Tax=Ridgeia piscesae TaxID=27915 RepID=A0AAD9PFN3_RIDPI|nr:hypothetical protein NP493_8g01010 [Ridgeia piscesae]